MGFIAKIKQHFKKHRSKAAVLAVLFSVMIVLSIRAVFQLQALPTFAAGSRPFDPAAAQNNSDGKEELVGVDAEEHIRESKELWHQLRIVHGTSVAVTFAFDSSFYPPDPSRKIVLTAPIAIDPLPATPVADNADAIRRAHELQIREQSKALAVHSTTVSATGKPWAIVNDQLLSVGDHVMGFEIAAIRSREVEFTKDGVTTLVKMPDEYRGQ